MKNKLLYELVWWLITAIIAVLVLLPIYNAIGMKYDYYVPNAVFIVVFITFTRWIFLLRYTFFSHIRWIKILLMIAPIPLFFYAMNELYDFQNIVDSTGLKFMMEDLSTDRYLSLLKYVQYEYIFFGSATMIVLFMLPLRMLISIWRVVNKKGTV